MTELPPEPEKIVEADFTIATSSAPDSVAWTIGARTGWAGLVKTKTDTSLGKVSFKASVAAPNPPDTIRFSLRTLGIHTATIKMAPQADGIYDQLAPVPDAIAMKLLIKLDSLAKIGGSGLAKTRAGLETLAARLLLDPTSIFKDQKQLPAGLTRYVLDSLALREATKGTTPLEIVARGWLVDMTFDQARTKLELWLSQKVPGIDSAAYRRMVPLENFPPEVVRLTADTLTVVKGGGKRSFLIELQDDSGMTSLKKTVMQNNVDASTFFSLDAPAFPSNKPISHVCTLKVATGTATVGTYVLQVEVTDNRGKKGSKELTFQVSENTRPVDPGNPGDPPVDPKPETNHAPIVVRQNPLTDTLTVSDITYAFSFQWTVSDIDGNLGKVYLQNKELELQNGIARQEVPLKLGDTTFVVIRATDAKGLEDIDTIRVYRQKRVEPKIEILSSAARNVEISDTQSTCQVRWKVTDTDLDSVKVDGKTMKASEGPEFGFMATLAPGTDKTIRIVAYDHLGSVVSDSVMIRRPKPIQPVIAYVSGKLRDTSVVDTQTTLKTRWKATDTDLDSLWIGDTVFKAVSGQEYEYVSHLAPGTNDTLFIVATDRLGSIVYDSLVIRRPHPRAKWKDLIAAVQSGADTVPLLKLSSGIAMGQFEVTRAVYAKYAGTAAPKDSSGYPANRLTVYEAILFCNALSKAKGLDTLYAYSTYDAGTGYLDTVTMRDTMKANAGALKGYRLPTRAEWNAASTLWGAYPWGSSTDAKFASDFAILAGGAISATGSRNPTGIGFFDLAGNVAEWTSERFGYLKTSTRWYSVGGSYTTSDLATVIAPNLMTGLTKDPVIGFRVVRIGSN
ncbi:MAG: SUMF1/EgtB/PvdO family nonheme iron enzyme [Fibrobacterota bacterium]|nr:SUMF1/EgtB/PvdO family nonheme iron enzyme [Fibrobacterota bacterium]QQS06139.1 MAG: SUMF1/EgtB/PvdO family nonheme iron enzyme [Fibrobacterota bacterium]